MIHLKLIIPGFFLNLFIYFCTQSSNIAVIIDRSFKKQKGGLKTIQKITEALKTKKENTQQ